MKKLSLRKEILLVVAIIAITFALSTSVFATANAPIQIPTINVNTTTENTTTNTTENVTPTNTTTVVPTTTTNTETSTYQNTTLPQTGDASDYAIFALIGLCVVVAVVAYRKARNYNI